MLRLVCGITGVAGRYQKEKDFFEKAAESQITASSIHSEIRARYEEVRDGNDQWRIGAGLDGETAEGQRKEGIKQIQYFSVTRVGNRRGWRGGFNEHKGDVRHC